MPKNYFKKAWRKPICGPTFMFLLLSLWCNGLRAGTLSSSQGDLWQDRMGSTSRLYHLLSASWTIRSSDGICVSIKPYLKIFCLFKNSLNSPKCPVGLRCDHIGLCRNGWIGILSSSIFPITGRLKALQRCSGLVPSQGRFLDCNLTASKNVTFCC